MENISNDSGKKNEIRTCRSSLSERGEIYQGFSLISADAIVPVAALKRETLLCALK